MQPDLLDFILVLLLEPDQCIPRLGAGFDKFVHLGLQRSAVAVLSRLKDWKKQQSQDADRQISARNEQFVPREESDQADRGQQKANQAAWPAGLRSGRTRS